MAPKVKILTDSTSDLPKEIAREYVENSIFD